VNCGMSIIYSVIARGSTILAEYSERTGNFKQASEAILPRIPPNDAQMTYAYDEHYFHYIVFGGITYLCMADQSFGRRIPFVFLQEMKKRFSQQFGARAQTALAYSLTDQFRTEMQSLLKFYNNRENDKIGKVRGEIENVKEVMTENIERLLDRGEKINLLVVKTDDLSQQSLHFKRGATTLRRNMWCKNVKLMILIVVIVLVVIFLIVLAVCHFNLSKC